MVNTRRLVHMALALPLAIAGGATVFVMGSTNVAAASTSASSSASATTPTSSSRPHSHEHVTCSPEHIALNGSCQVKFSEKRGSGESSGQQVCFDVTPGTAGQVHTGHNHCTTTNGGGNAFGTFTSNGSFCGKVTITATEPAEHRDSHHTVIRIRCETNGSPTTSALTGAPIGGSGPAGFAMGGVGLALMTGLSLRARRFVIPWRLPDSVPA